MSRQRNERGKKKQHNKNPATSRSIVPLADSKGKRPPEARHLESQLTTYPSSAITDAFLMGSLTNFPLGKATGSGTVDPCRVTSQKLDKVGRPQCTFVPCSSYGTRGGQVCWWSVLLLHRQCRSLKSSIVMDDKGGVTGSIQTESVL